MEGGEGRGGRQEVLWERTKREKKKKKEGGEDGRGCEENARSGEKRRDEVKHRWPEEEGRCRCSRERERKERKSERRENRFSKNYNLKTYWTPAGDTEGGGGS